MGPLGLLLELFKVGVDKCLKFLTNIFNGFLIKDKLPLIQTLQFKLFNFFLDQG